MLRFYKCARDMKNIYMVISICFKIRDLITCIVAAGRGTHAHVYRISCKEIK